MARRAFGAVMEPGSEPDQTTTDGLRSRQHPLPVKAEAALREAGLWDGRFVRQLAYLDPVTLDALGVIGAWDDLDREDMSSAFERMRHERLPSPPVEL